MKSRLVACAASLLVGCGSSAGEVSALAHSYAASYCHFIYHCCTPSDRANQYNPFSVTLSTEENLNFDTEEGCTNELGVQFGIGFGPYEDSVAAKRMSYAESGGQACLSALASASAKCDPNAFWTASANSEVCDFSAFFVGLTPPNGSCTMNADCSVGNSVCEPVDGGLGREGPSNVVSGAATCSSPPADGMPCSYEIAGGACRPGSCCRDLESTCAPYVAVGAACNNDEVCGTNSCDPAVAYNCDVAGSGNCATLIADGGACNPSYYGEDCATFNCVPSSNGTAFNCQTRAETIQICVGNPNGF